MTDLHYNVFYLITNFFSMFVIQRFYRIFFEPTKKPMWVAVGTYMLYPVVTSAEHLTFNIPILTLLLNLMCLFLITLLYDASMTKRCNAVAFTYVFMFIMEMLALVAAGIFHFDLADKASYVSVTVQIVLKLLTFLAAAIAGVLKNIRGQKMPVALQFIASVGVISISIYEIFVVLATRELSKLTVVLSVSGIMIINVLLFGLYDVMANYYTKSLSTAIYEKQKLYYQHECEMMKMSQEEMAAFRHDVQNHLAVLEQMLQGEQNSEEVCSYLLQLKNKTKETGVFCNSGNLAIDSVINYKLRNIGEHNITANINVAVPEKMDVEIADIVTILGNLLDNAIDALLEVQGERKLYLKLLYTKGRLILNIRNNFNGEMTYQNGRIISKKKGGRHGYGLKNVQEALKKCSGTLLIKHKENVFSANVIMYI